MKVSKYQQKKQKVSLWKQLVQSIVRPPIRNYHLTQLGGKQINCLQKLFIRKEYNVEHECKNIQLTLYQSSSPGKYVILYLHGNSSCRIEAQGLLRFLPEDVSLASFDFMGCGKNTEMQTISLGLRQSQQAKTVTQFLTKQGFTVILWGRSMGAVASLLYGKVQFIVADSSFKSFKSVCKQTAKNIIPIPNCLINCLFPCVYTKLRSDVDKRANYDIQKLDVKKAVQKLDKNTTVVFISGLNDDLIISRNSQKLYEICPIPNKQKHLILCDGDHNSRRPEKIMKQVMSIIKEYISEKSKSIIISEKSKSTIYSELIVLDFK